MHDAWRYGGDQVNQCLNNSARSIEDRTNSNTQLPDQVLVVPSTRQVQTYNCDHTELLLQARPWPYRIDHGSYTIRRRSRRDCSQSTNQAAVLSLPPLPASEASHNHGRQLTAEMKMLPVENIGRQAQAGDSEPCHVSLLLTLVPVFLSCPRRPPSYCCDGNAVQVTCQSSSRNRRKRLDDRL